VDTDTNNTGKNIKITDENADKVLEQINKLNR
jgi:hypothetical protein